MEFDREKLPASIEVAEQAKALPRSIGASILQLHDLPHRSAVLVKNRADTGLTRKVFHETSSVGTLQRAQHGGQIRLRGSVP